MIILSIIFKVMAVVQFVNLLALPGLIYTLGALVFPRAEGVELVWVIGKTKLPNPIIQAGRLLSDKYIVLKRVKIPSIRQNYPPIAFN
jgi:hypothetical protein